MAKLSEERQKLLEELEAERDAPEPSNAYQEIRNIHIDLSDEAAVKRAQGLGLLGAFQDLLNGGDDTDDTDDTDEDKPKGDKAPKRSGFFAEK